MKWMIRVEGDPSDLEFAASSATDAPTRLVKEGDVFRLLSPRLHDDVEPGEVKDLCLDLLREIAAMVGYTLGRRPTFRLAHVSRLEDGRPPTQYLMVDPIVSRVTVFPARLSIDGVVGENVLDRIARLQEAEPRLTAAMDHLVNEGGWYGLYKAYEVIRAARGTGRSIVRAGWATAAELGRFTRTANSVEALGSAARHGVPKVQPPLKPMSLEDADRLIGRLLGRWMQELDRPPI